ncbi:hypothetical protein P691DRAFT_676957 [Macrolepiota fuliginosa MF-IS2]|uniref:Uncharacterized protein n=1 Tax=Macrolepiota fuliginosa MF-IS2 TaxID=1400762 RepID=A0A9P5X6V6_9AGAR|nr:hypothetical protein P691DRAFT_676957 [Macrolepiota fuliginosa MF-IS2]
MSISTESERQRYAQELAAYTLRQFAAARSSVDQTGPAATPSASPQRDQRRTPNKAPGTLGGVCSDPSSLSRGMIKTWPEILETTRP